MAAQPQQSNAPDPAPAIEQRAPLIGRARHRAWRPAQQSEAYLFLLRQYFLGIPRDLDEAARMDGASSLRVWWQIIMPLSGPALAVLAIFVSLNS